MSTGYAGPGTAQADDPGPRTTPPQGHRTLRFSGGALARPLEPVVGPRRRRTDILRLMTRALDAAIAKLATLPADEQDRIAQWLLDELRDEEHWTRHFSASQDTLSKLAAEARADRAAGRATELDPDEL